jgi:hypothetical protein
VKRLCPVVLLILASAPAGLAQPDLNTLVRDSVYNYQRSMLQGQQWSYTQTDVNCADGKKEIEVSEIIPLDGTPYQRVIAKNGEPLSASDRRKEDQKFDRELRKRQEESPEERKARLEKYQKDRAFIEEVPDAYDFKLIGEDTVEGRPAWVVSLTPKPGFVPRSSHAELLRHIEGKLWIDKQDQQWAKAEAHVIDTINIGYIVARIEPGARITLGLSRVNSQLWVTKEITINGAAKVLLVHTKNLDEQLTFTGYHQDKPTGPQVARR